ncbi:NUDIX hydrolase domain-like protein [Fennellomyces sp. T-0311]|nr:NUDIX hydrolase domain-like protein [Fennellomyces sp. T-0311]
MSNNVPPQPEIEYTKKARHGHGQDMVDENNVRQVAGCLPIDPVNRRFLLVSSRKRPGAWVIPKGGWEQDETQEHAALRETWEEAGIKGQITRHIGVFAERNKKGVKAHHWIYELEIREVVKKFPEKKKRERRWFTYDEALIATKSAYLHDAIRLSSLNPAIHEEQQSNATPRQSQETFAKQPPSPPRQHQTPPPQQQQDQLPPSPPNGEASKKSFGKQLKSLFQSKPK